MKPLAIFFYCLLFLGCRNPTIEPALENSVAVVLFNKKEIIFDQLIVLPRVSDDSREYLLSGSYTETKIDDTTNNPLRYSTSIIFREDPASMEYIVTQVNIDIAAFLDDQRISYNSFSTVLPKSNVSFVFTTNKVGKVVGTLQGELKNWNLDIIPEIDSKDSTLEVSGHFDLNFDTIKHSP